MKTAFYADNIWYDGALCEGSWLLTENGSITGITSNQAQIREYKEIRFKNSAIFPGLINTHAHLAMSLFRGMADDLPLMTWLNEYIWPAEKKAVSYSSVYAATMLSAAECIRSGVTCVNNMYFFPQAEAKALEKAGIRAVVGFGTMTSPEKAFKEADLIEETDLIKKSVCPHSLYVSGLEVLKKCVEFAKSRNMVFHTHLAETLDETEKILAKYGKNPAELMNDTGAFDYEKSVFAHCVHLNEVDIKILGDKKVNVSHCLESNLKLASGFAPIVKLIKAGANVSIGTDGAASNNDQSMIGEMSSVSKFHKAFNMDATALPASLVLEMATLNGAKALGIRDIGVLKKGYKADFFVLSFDASHMTPVYNPVSHLMYAAQSGDVTDVYVAGKAVMTDGKILSFDEEEVKNKILEMVKSK